MSDGDLDLHDDGWPCLFSQAVAALLEDPAATFDLLSAVLALSVEINETRGNPKGYTVDPAAPAFRRVVVSTDAAMFVAEFTVLADAVEPYSILTRVQPI
ncbi:hypothetical protein [Streptacidiphilus sp. PAMC 29251]